MITCNERKIPVVGTLLESLEEAGVKIESHCRNGFCGMCRTTLSKGEVEYLTEPMGFTRNGEVLACCCKPKTDIEIKLIA